MRHGTPSPLLERLLSPIAGFLQLVGALVEAAVVPMFRRKVLADARALSGQTISLMILVAIGVLLFVGLYQAYQFLTVTYSTIYTTGRLADASVLFDRGPEGLVDQARTIPHVREAMGRVVRDGAIIQEGREHERVVGRFVGVPRFRPPVINDLLLVQGRRIRNANEAVLEHQFAAESGYRLGDVIKCSYVGAEREFTLVGFAVSPEYVYPVPSQYALFVARGTFGVVFIDEARAREWLGIGRQITELHVLTDPGNREEVLEKLEGLVDGYGLETGFVQDDQPSKRLLDMDQQGFATLSVFFPLLFLAAAGLSLYGALTRIVRLQVSLIGMLKACGFSDAQILVQHVLQGVIVSVGGAVPGVGLGHLLAQWLGKQYAASLKLAMFYTEPQWATMGGAFLMAAGTGFVAAYLPARMAARLAPAVAMRGDIENPRGIMAQRRLTRLIRLPRVVYLIPVRGIFRRASRTLLAMAGIIGGTAIIITTFGMHVSTMDAIDEYLQGTRTYEIDAQFTSPGGLEVARFIRGLPGVREVSLNTGLPVRIRTHRGEAELMLTGIQSGQRLLRLHAVTGELIHTIPDGIWVPLKIAERLGVEKGDPIWVEWTRTSRRRPIGRLMRVSGRVDVSMGNSCYGEYHDVRRAFSDRVYPESSYGAFIACDPARTEALRRRLERSDAVAAVTTTRDAEEQIEEQMGLMFIFIGVLLSFGSILAGAAVQSVASVSIMERTRELATLRSLGFAARSAAGLIAFELYVLAMLGLIVGIPLGVRLNTLFMASYNTENMTFRAVLPPWVHVVTVAIVFALVGASAWAGARRIAAMDLSQATKARE